MLRYYLDFYSAPTEAGNDAQQWRVEIWDSEFSGTATAILGNLQGFVIEWEGDNDPVGPVMASSCTMDMLIEEVGDMAIVTAIAGAPEGQFKMVVKKGGASTVYWAGWIRSNDSSYPDNYYPFHFSIFATDGIARLKDLPYTADGDGEGEFFTGSQTIIKHIVRIINKIETYDVGTWPAARIRSTANWYNSLMLSGDDCPLSQVEVLHDAFHRIDDHGNKEPWNCYAVLDALLRPFNCQFLHENGMYHIRQIDSYENDTQRAFYYDQFGDAYDDEVENLNISVSYASAGAMRKTAGNRYTWLRPLKSVCTDYQHITSQNRATGQKWDRLNTGWEILPWVVLVDEVDKTFIKGSITLSTRSQIGINPPGSAIYPAHRYVFKVQIKMEASGGQYYSLQRTVLPNATFYDIQPDELTWAIGADNSFEIYTSVHTQADNLQEKLTNVTFTTPFLLTGFSGKNIEMKISLLRVERTDGNTLTVPGGNYVGRIDDWKTSDVFIGVEKEGIGSNPDNETLRTCAVTASKNAEKLIVETYLGDGPAPFSLSALRVGGVATSEWMIGFTGTEDLPIAALLAKQLLSLRQLPQAVYQGAFLKKDITPVSRFVDGDTAWMATRISVNAFTNLWDGEFLIMNRDIDGITTGEPFPPGLPNTGGISNRYPKPPTVPERGRTGSGTAPAWDGFKLSPLPEYVAIGEQAATDLRTDLLASDFNDTHQLPINPVNFHFVKKGDTVTVVNSITGYRESFVVATSYAPGSNRLDIRVTDTMLKDFPYGSFVKVAAGQARPPSWSYYALNVTGTGAGNKLWTIPTSVGVLPDPTDYDAETIRERVEVVMGGTRLVYDSNNYAHAFGINAALNQIEVYLGIIEVPMFIKVN